MPAAHAGSLPAAPALKIVAFVKVFETKPLLFGCCARRSGSVPRARRAPRAARARWQRQEGRRKERREEERQKMTDNYQHLAMSILFWFPGLDKNPPREYFLKIRYARNQVCYVVSFWLLAVAGWPAAGWLAG